MREILIDGNHMTTRQAAHDELAKKLSLPVYYGRNLDALYDCLTEIGQPTTITLVHAAQLESALGPYGGILLRVLRDADSENDFLSVRIATDTTW